MNGVTAVIFRADFGPLNEAIELSAEDGYEEHSVPHLLRTQ